MRFQHCFCWQVLGYWKDAAHTINGPAFGKPQKRMPCMVAILILGLCWASGPIRRDQGTLLVRAANKETTCILGSPQHAYLLGFWACERDLG